MHRLASSQAIGQIALLAVTPILTRLYSPSDIGLFQIALVLGVAFSPFLTLRLEGFIPGMALNVGRGLRRLGQLIPISIGILSLIGFFTLEFLKNNEASQILRMIFCIGLVCSVTGVTAVDNSWLAAKNDRKRLAYRNTFSGILAALFQVIGGLIFSTFFTLVVALLLGRLVALLITASPSPPRAPEDVSIHTALKILGYRGVVVAMFASVVGNLSPQIGLFAVASGAGPAGAGQFAIAQRTAMAPATLFGAGFAQHFSIELGEVVRSGRPDAWKTTKKQLLATLPLGGAVAILLALFGLFGFSLVFGEEWQEAGLLTAILSPALSLQVALGPLANGFALMNYQRIHFWLEASKVILASVVFVIVINLGFTSPIVLTCIFALVALSGHVLFYICFYYVVKRWDAQHAQ